MAFRLIPGLENAEVREKEKAKAVLKRAFEVKEPEDPAEHEENLAEARRMLGEGGETPP